MRKLFFLFVVSFFYLSNIFAAEFYFDLDKNQHTYEEMVKPEKTVLYVWATWCPSCRNDLSKIVKDDSILDDVNVVFLSIGESSQDVKAAISALKMTNEN